MTDYEANDVPREPEAVEDPTPEQDSVAHFAAEIPPEYAVPQRTVEEQLAEANATLARPAANLDVHGAPHFLRNVNGEEVCGQDGLRWPCPAWQEIETGAHVAQGIDPGAQEVPTMAEAALAAGMDLDEFLTRLRQNRQQ
jgi:hypothetical protein